MKIKNIILAVLLGPTSLFATVITYTYDAGTTQLTNDANGNVIGTLVFSGSGSSGFDISDSSFTAVTTGFYNFNILLGNPTPISVDTTYTLTLNSGYALASAKWGSGIGGGILGGITSGGVTQNEFTLSSSSGVDLNATTVVSTNANYSVTGNGTTSLAIDGSDSGSGGALQFAASGASNFGAFWSTENITATTDTLTYANTSTMNTNIANERLGLQLTIIPEPSSAMLLGLGGITLLARRKRK